jgi:ribosomal protein S17E
MGRIKSKLIKRTGNTLLSEENKFEGSFDTNKKILSNSLPGKKIRNQVAGFISRKKKVKTQ